MNVCPKMSQCVCVRAIRLKDELIRDKDELFHFDVTTICVNFFLLFCIRNVFFSSFFSCWIHACIFFSLVIAVAIVIFTEIEWLEIARARARVATIGVIQSVQIIVCWMHMIHKFVDANQNSFRALFHAIGRCILCNTARMGNTIEHF